MVFQVMPIFSAAPVNVPCMAAGRGYGMDGPALGADAAPPIPWLKICDPLPTFRSDGSSPGSYQMRG